MAWNYRLLTLLLLTSSSCSRDIDVAENKAAIVFNKDRIKDVVLRTGTHKIAFMSDTILYDIGEQTMNFRFDILFKDASSADIDFSIQYIPKVDSLVSVSKRYKQGINHYPISIILKPEARAQVRKLLMTIDVNGPDDKQIFEIVEQNLRTSEPVNRIAEITSFHPGKIEFKN